MPKQTSKPLLWRQRKGPLRQVRRQRLPEGPRCYRGYPAEGLGLTLAPWFQRGFIVYTLVILGFYCIFVWFYWVLLSFYWVFIEFLLGFYFCFSGFLLGFYLVCFCVLLFFFVFFVFYWVLLGFTRSLLGFLLFCCRVFY